MLKVGIVGSGFGLYGQLPAFNSIKNCQVVSICGKSTPRLLNYCQSIGLKKIYSNWKLMLENEQLDAIAVAVTPDAQYKIVKAAINKGLHIFAEKPLAENFKHAKELTLLAQKK
jgi:predicted dehydrogenase